MPNRFSSIVQLFSPVTSSLGLEITDSSIKMTELRLYKSKPPEIKAYHVEKLPKKAVEDGRILEPVTVTRALQTLTARVSQKTKFVHMVLPSQAIMVRFLKFPDIAHKDLVRLVDFEMKHHIHLPFDQPVYDFVKMNGTEAGRLTGHSSRRQKKIVHNKLPEASKSDDLFGQAAASKESGGLDLKGVGGLFGDSRQAEEGPQVEETQCEVMLVAAPRELVDEYMNAVKAANLKVSSLEIKALSLYRVIEYMDFADKQGTLLVLDINERLADMSIFHDGMLKITRTVPVSFSEKEEGGAASDIDQLFAAFSDPDADFRGSCGDLAHELERLMNFYRYTLNNRSQEFSRLVLAGDVGRLNEIAGLLRERLQLEITMFYTERVQVQNMFQDLFPVYAVPIGLALRGNST